MTAVAAVLVAGLPALVGDVVLSDLRGERMGHAGKVYVLAPNVALGWSGNLSLAKPALIRLRQQLGGGRFVSRDRLDRALNSLSIFRYGTRAKLELTGWIVDEEGPKVVRWASWHSPTRFCEVESDIGSGGNVLRKLLADPEIGHSNTRGLDVAPMKLVSGFMEARFEEMLLGAKWPTTWGVAYDAILFQRGAFRWLPKLTYIGWDITVDAQDRITGVTQAPVVFTHEREHPYTVMFASTLGVEGFDTKISAPIDGTDTGRRDFLLLEPRTVVSPYYANYFRVFCPDNALYKLSWAAENATPAGAMYHAGAGEQEPKFAVNQQVLEPFIRLSLHQARERERQRGLHPPEEPF